MSGNRLILAVVVALLGSALVAQEQKTPEEGLREQVLELKALYAKALADNRACLGVLAPLAAKADRQQLDDEQEALRVLIEGNHPGYLYNVQTRKLVKKPETAK